MKVGLTPKKSDLIQMCLLQTTRLTCFLLKCFLLQVPHLKMHVWDFYLIQYVTWIKLYRGKKLGNYKDISIIFIVTIDKDISLLVYPLSHFRCNISSNLENCDLSFLLWYKRTLHTGHLSNWWEFILIPAGHITGVTSLGFSNYIACCKELNQPWMSSHSTLGSGVLSLRPLAFNHVELWMYFQSHCLPWSWLGWMQYLLGN